MNKNKKELFSVFRHHFVFLFLKDSYLMLRIINTRPFLLNTLIRKTRQLTGNKH